jgi:cyclophilin family peptidyl-prolyl cis-trans isomerase
LRPALEALEARQLLSASLAPISNVVVPAQLGYQVPLDGSGDIDPSQTYSVTSDNPDVQVSVAQGPFWTLNVQHMASSQPGDISFAGALVFQLFNDLTPNTVAQITNFTNQNYYNGKDFTRIASNFPGPTDFVAQGGAPNKDGTGNSGFPNFPDEFVQQLAFSGTQQLAMANAGPNTNNTQFFVTAGTPAFLDFRHTVFGQLVAGSNILTAMTRVSTMANPALGGEKSQPVNPIVINSAMLSSSNVNGVIHVDTTSARAGETANVTVTASDPTDESHVIQSFKVTVSDYNGPTSNWIVPINFIPLANPGSATTQENVAATVQLLGQSGFPDRTTPGTLTYQLLSQPAHGTISQFNPATGTLVYTPAPGYLGPDSFQYLVQATGPKGTPAITTSRPATISISVSQPPLVTLAGLDEVFNKRHRLTEVFVHFSGAVNATQAGETQIYRLALPGRKGSYTARNAPIIRLKKAVYNAQSDTVTLQLRTPLALTKKAQLRIDGLPPLGLTDSLGRLIDGDHNGAPGGNAIAYLSQSGVSLALEAQRPTRIWAGMRSWPGS